MRKIFEFILSPFSLNVKYSGCLSKRGGRKNELITSAAQAKLVEAPSFPVSRTWVAAGGTFLAVVDRSRVEVVRPYCT